jgi:DNA mismatch repair protein Mlh1 C-terminus
MCARATAGNAACALRVQDALEAVESHAHTALCASMREHTFVGHVAQRSVLLQHRTRLLLADVGALSRDLLYQAALQRFGEYGAIALDDAPAVAELLAIALEAREAQGLLEGEDENKVRPRRCGRVPARGMNSRGAAAALRQHA